MYCVEPEARNYDVPPATSPDRLNHDLAWVQYAHILQIIIPINMLELRQCTSITSGDKIQALVMRLALVEAPVDNGHYCIDGHFALGSE